MRARYVQQSSIAVATAAVAGSLQGSALGGARRWSHPRALLEEVGEGEEERESVSARGESKFPRALGGVVGRRGWVAEVRGQVKMVGLASHWRDLFKNLQPWLDL